MNNRTHYLRLITQKFTNLLLTALVAFMVAFMALQRRVPPPIDQPKILPFPDEVMG